MAAEENLPTARRAGEATWRQGSIFRGQVAFLWNGLGGDIQTPSRQSRKTRASECLVVISQDCDIIEADSREPYVEAMICRTETNPEFLRRIDRNSARWFVVDPAHGLVAEARYRLQIAKDLLAQLTPEPWPSSPERLQRFVRWLARRYDRPALPDPMVESFQRPLQEAIEGLPAETSATLNSAVLEIRVNMPGLETPPFELQLVYLVRRDELTEEELKAINVADQAIRASLDPDQVILAPGLRLLSDEEMSLAEYLATRPVFLEFLTYQGEEVVGITAQERA